MHGVRKELSEGRFDITVGKLSALWDFSSGKNVVPAEEEILAELPGVGYEKLELIGLETPTGEALSVWLTPETHLDLGAIAKGYIVDQVRLFLKEKLSWKTYAFITVVIIGILLLAVAEEL